MLAMEPLRLTLLVQDRLNLSFFKIILLVMLSFANVVNCYVISSMILHELSIFSKEKKMENPKKETILCLI